MRDDATFTSNYKVIFNGNVGTVTMNNQSTYETYLSTFTYLNYSASKDGYTFNDWSSKSTDTTVFVGTVKLEDTLTLYAIWKKCINTNFVSSFRINILQLNN